MLQPDPLPFARCWLLLWLESPKKRPSASFFKLDDQHMAGMIRTLINTFCALTRASSDMMVSFPHNMRSVGTSTPTKQLSEHKTPWSSSLFKA
jgi:hypothetical protein